MILKLLAIAWVFLAGALGTAQVAIVNPQHLEVPEQRAQMLHHIICRVVGNELRLRGAKAQFAVTVILGEQEQRVIADKDTGNFKIYLRQWDEPSFAIGDLQVVLQLAMVRKHWYPMMQEVVRRYQQVAPVQANTLSDAHVPNRPSAATWPFAEPK